MTEILISKNPPGQRPSAFDLFHLSRYNSFPCGGVNCETELFGRLKVDRGV